MVYYLQGIKHQFTVFAISEIWLKNHNESIYNIKGFTHICVNRESLNGGGVALYIRESISFKIRSDLSIDLIDVNILFIQINKCELSCKSNILIGVCYRAPHVNPSDFIEKLEDLLEQLQQEKSIVYFCVDFNFDTLNLSPACHTKPKEFKNVLSSYFYQPVITGYPSRETDSGSRSLIDNIYLNINNSGKLCQGAILKTKFSDHYSIIAITNLTYTSSEVNIVCRREYNNKNKSKFRKRLTAQCWDYIYDCEIVNNAFTYFHNQCRYIYEECFPKKNIRITYSNS